MARKNSPRVQKKLDEAVAKAVQEAKAPLNARIEDLEGFLREFAEALRGKARMLRSGGPTVQYVRDNIPKLLDDIASEAEREAEMPPEVRHE